MKDILYIFLLRGWIDSGQHVRVIQTLQGYDMRSEDICRAILNKGGS